ncbi:pachytene checkpoint protein 2 homolog [Macrobrachium nipponense]|uniref:pachytene checkpoint protein 2 homolog n=1 Tax=Macrobrachium nipponense TaxID=159736 RepID=UPI0030C7E1A9
MSRSSKDSQGIDSSLSPNEPFDPSSVVTVPDPATETGKSPTLKDMMTAIQALGQRVKSLAEDRDKLWSNVRDLKVASDTKSHVETSSVEIDYYVYKLEHCGPGIEELEESEEEIPAATHWMLPALEFEDLWENLVYDEPIKEQLLRFVRTSLLFSKKGLKSSVITWNKVVLLHGPPGTGKTSLCKALAQKLSIRMNKQYKCAQILEINSHSLFSKWFSETSVYRVEKLVQKMFNRITELVEDPESLVLLLIDEVESLTLARRSGQSNGDPSDAVRVVNAVLTQLDQIKKFPNVLILTTSNISASVDLAFVDRADIKQYIGPPSHAAIYQIYHTCIQELERTGIIVDNEKIFTLQELQVSNMIENDATKLSIFLWKISEMSQGFSGRVLRKIPFLAHALFASLDQMSHEQFLMAMQKAVLKEKQDRRDLRE